jgi:hypothetical protein
MSEIKNEDINNINQHSDSKLILKSDDKTGFDPNTNILMADKSIKKIKDIKIGESVCGDDNTPRKVTHIFNGNNQMYLIKQKKLEDYIVNENHILILKTSGITPYVSKCPGKSKYYRLSYYIICTENTCNNTNCCKKGLKSKEISYKTEVDALNAKIILMNGNLDPNYVSDGTIIEISIKDYINICSKNVKLVRLNGYRVPYPIFDYENSNLPLDPYFLGIWLGDGDNSGMVITSVDPEIEMYLNTLASKYDGMTVIKQTVKQGSVSSTGIISKKDYHKYTMKYCKKGERNPIRKEIQKLGIFKNKHIPDIYMKATEQDRLKLLAGLMDTDGNLNYSESRGSWMYDFTQSEKNKNMVFQVKLLAESCGIMTSKKIGESQHKPVGNKTIYKDGKKFHTHYRLKLSGKNIKNIPCLIERKKAYIKCENQRFLVPNLSKIIVAQTNDSENYIGITVDDNHKFLLADCTVVHD